MFIYDPVGTKVEFNFLNEHVADAVPIGTTAEANIGNGSTGDFYSSDHVKSEAVQLEGRLSWTGDRRLYNAGAGGGAQRRI